ncbi:poly(A) RNA polymerase gld-2 homolog B isoform X2 [Drosophila biarmipes]|uniref:poly(A) RNA polymerase gld-2 homolog B isoform X2 n=1 Tax=Drosophila biarmipes TaxID=125945 RepID=UPI0021CCAB51|nr:poly(A) RNA polymerase gld-2 homolog B isoform X2 [Drosophila biarmipes]
MFTTRISGDMKIFAADVAESSATATCNTPVQQQQQQQQLEFRSRMSNGSPGSKAGQCHLKFGKYNHKTANLLRQVSSCHSGSNSNNSSNSESNKGQQQQQLHYCNNSHSWARKKYFGNSGSSSSSNNVQQQQQQQSAYYQRQQQQDQQALNNNNVLMKNQNILQQVADGKASDSNNNGGSSNRMAAKPAKWPNDNSSGSNSNSVGCRNSNSNSSSTKKRNSSSAEATAAYYRKDPESRNPDAAAEATEADAAATDACNTSASTTGSSSGSASAETSLAKGQDPEQDQTAKQRPRQQPLSFWKTNYPQPSASQLKDETVAAVVSAAAAAASEQQQQQQSLSFEHRRNSGYQQHQQHNYYPYYYSQPKQLTIASFLQKELLPESSEKPTQHSSSSSSNASNNGNLISGNTGNSSSNSNTGSSNHISSGNSNSNSNGNSNGNYSRQQYGHQSVGNGYQQQQQRYRNAQNAYQQYQHQHQHQQQQQQQQHHAQQLHPHQQGMGNSHFRRKNSDNSSHSSGINQKKMHYSPPGKNGDPTDRSSSAQQQQQQQQQHHHHPHQQQKSIEILTSSNFNAMHRRMQGGSNKNGYYQHNYHPLAGETGSTPTRSEHQNLYNLTYIHVDMEASATDGAGAGATPVVKSSLLSKPSISITPASATTPTATVERGLPPAPLRSLSAPALPAPTNHVRNMFAPPPLAMIGPHGLLSPVTTTSTPTKMISCAQLDEAITAAAASGDQSVTTSPSYNQAGSFVIPHQQQPQQQSHLTPACSMSQPPPPPPPQMFFHFAEGFCNPGLGHQARPAPVWPHSSSPCYPASYGSSCSLSGNGTGSGTSPHNKDGNAVGLRPVSPALSSSSLGSESHWSSTSNRSRLGHGGHLSISPTPSALGSAQLSPHLAEMHPLHQQHPPPLANHHPHGQMNGHAMNSYVPHRPPPPPPHPPISSPTPTIGATGGGGGGGAGGLTPWYELLLPPDRYLAQARNVEVAVTPEKLICMCKYDKLSAEIWKRFRGAQQTHKKFKMKMRLWRYLFLWMNQPMFERYRICLVGSTITGFGTDSSDIDMCLLPEQGAHLHQQHYHQHHHFHNEKRTEALIILTLFNAVLKDTEVFQDFNLIEARVPILRFKDITNGIEVDLNFNNCVGIKNTYLLQLYAQLDWRTRPLVVIVKLWAQYHDINDAKRMTISSYSLVLMVLHYLQHACVPHVLPCLHTLYPEKFQLGPQDCLDLDLIEPIEPYQALNNQTLGEHLLGFFKYYSSFDFRNLAISIRTGGVLPVSTCRMAKSPKNDVYQWKELNIEEPFDLSNTARSVYDHATFERVKAVFLASARRLDHTLDLATVFRPIHHAPENFAPQQPASSSFEQQLHHPNPGQQRSGGGGGAAAMSSRLIPEAPSTFAETAAANVA